MKNQKQHRRGKKISRKLANLGAISQDTKDLCLECCAELTQTDYDAEYCTQCGTKIPVYKLEKVA